MPITRAQYISGDSGDGVVLSGEVQGVKQGFGVIIDSDGTISVDPTVLLPSRFVNLKLSANFDGVQNTFTLIDLVTSAPVVPTPSDNIIVFVGGVPQVPLASYSISGGDILFTSPPPAGASFFAVTTAFL
jgi:hypothetical protein